jgi:two-component system, chemotaxis family, chemotaxis protein CheY
VNQILIVDDSPTIRRMVKASLAALSDDPCEFVEASSGLEAIERLALGPVELMVLDLNMPDMHGLEVLGFVRSHSKYRQVPVIILTTRGDDASRAAALEAGATAYMTKPFTPGTLATKARELLGQDAR